ncbi:hypothetical protein V7S43_008134 [Phytophthora oleae]|uniref:ELMO domain-containing protein n=1 Tax=Phytophthora oleae TaxID=2107226 RepID=A0ABD3FJ94_9STRA
MRCTWQCQAWPLRVTCATSERSGRQLMRSGHGDANLLATTLDTLNISLLNDIRAHYRDPKNKPYPGSDGNPVLVELNKYLENTGANDPFQKIYVTVAEPMEGLAAMLMLFVVAYMPKLQYDRNFGALSRVGKNPIDGEPLLVGILTIFKQFHPSYTEKFLAYMGQFVRTKVNDIFAEKAEKKGKTPSLPPHCYCALDFVLLFSALLSARISFSSRSCLSTRAE